ncbi:MAG: CaiB/BaiF CoA transferase family protein [Alphaproteobacteria bacterium]
MMALSDIKVLETGSMLAGPFCGTLLGDFGAEVIKLEKPGKPDALREWPPFKDGQPLWWKAMARNKRLATLDISRPEARDATLALIGRSDIVIENFRPGTLERWGLGPGDLAVKFPHIVWVRVSGYGQTGPYSGRGGYATIAEAYSGLASFTGFPDRGPMVSAFPLGDYVAGTYAAFGAMAAINARRQTGRGQVVDVSLFEPFLRILESAIVRYDQTGKKKPLLGNQMEEDVPRNIYATRDGYVAISVGSQAIFNNLLDAMGRADLKGDPRFSSQDARAEHRDETDGLVRDWLAQRITAEALKAFEVNKVVAGKINDMADVFADPHIAAREALTTVMDPQFGPMRLPAPVPKLSETPGSVRWTGGEPGRDNDHVFREVLGLSAQAIDGMRKAGVL